MPDYSHYNECNMMIGKRIEIPVHFDMWMRGARFGVIHSVRKKDCAWMVRMDHPQIKKLVRITGSDKDFCKVL